MPNVFVFGASVFPQNVGFNPTGMVGALAYWGARRHQEPVSEKSRPAGVGVRSVIMQNSMFRTAFAAGVFMAASAALVHHGAGGHHNASASLSLAAQQEAQTIAEGHYLAQPAIARPAIPRPAARPLPAAS